MAEMDASLNHIRIAKVVGENEEGMTLFVPKNMNGVFELSYGDRFLGMTLFVPKNMNGVFELADGDRFLTMMFVHQVGPDMEAWLPWEG